MKQAIIIIIQESDYSSYEARVKGVEVTCPFLKSCISVDNRIASHIPRPRNTRSAYNDNMKEESVCTGQYRYYYEER